jgi:predicted nucleic acid-binding Zn ribbon protein
MPTYEYRCTKCGEHLEVYQSFSEEPLKGSGFYRTDNRGGSKTTAKEPAKEAVGSDSSGSSTTSDSSSGTSGSSGSSGSKPGADSKSGSKPGADSKSGSKSAGAKTA